MKKNEKTIASLENQKQSLTNVKGGQKNVKNEIFSDDTPQGIENGKITSEPGRPVSPTSTSNKRISTRTVE